MKALLMWIQFSLETIDEILLFKCRMQSSENNIEMLTKSDTVVKVDITYIENYYQYYDDRISLDLRNFYFNTEKQMCWILIGGDFMRKISEASNNQSYLKFEFCCYTTTHDMKPEYKLFRNLNQTALGSVESRNKDDPLKLLNIKDNLLLLCRRKLELFIKYKTFIDAEFLKTHAKFKPLYYNTHAECFESLKSLFKFENFLRIIEDIDSFNTTTSPTVVKSYFIETLGKKFEEDFKNLNNEENYQNLYSKFEYLCNVVLGVTKEILLLPIVSKFDVERHFNNICNFIKNLFDKLQEDPDWIKDKINMMLKCYKLLDNLKKYSANGLFKFIENDIGRSSNLFEFHSRLYGKEKDYNLLVLEKIVCDYTNTMQSILKGIEESKHYSLKTFLPLRVSEDESLLIKAFKITLKDDIKNIKVYYFEGHE